MKKNVLGIQQTASFLLCVSVINSCKDRTPTNPEVGTLTVLYAKEGWGYKRSAYSGDGKLLTDQWEIPDIPNELSIAYLAEENALYIDGVLYYRK